PHLPGADAVLQDRRGLHGVAQRPSGSLRYGGRSAEHALAAAFVRAFSPGRRCGADREAGARGAPDEGSAGVARDRAVRDFSHDHYWLSLNTATVRMQWKLDRIIEECARRRIRAICPWRDQVAAVGLDTVARLVRNSALALLGYWRGGVFPATTREGRQQALDDNRRAVDDAKTLNASCLVLVVGGLPGALQGKPEHKDLFAARNVVRDGIAATLEYARSAGMPLAIEPLHPMYAAERARVNTSEQALDL